jgi:formiminoglutamase
MKIPHTRPPVWPELSATRFAAGIRRDSAEACAVALIGLPDDTGVRLNGGRSGAADGPDAFRAALGRYGTLDPAFGAWPEVFDAGDVEPGSSLEETHRRVTEATAALCQRGLLPVAIGGGHDLTWPFVRAVAAAAGPLAGVYFDAHLDVRQEDGSGMAFHRLLESGAAKSLELHGFNPLVNSSEHLDWFRSHGGKLATPSSQPEFPANGPLFVSFDLDAIDASSSPGVSAPHPAGMAPAEAAAWVHAAGLCKGVRCFDLMELNPRYDSAGRTARLAAHLFLSFLRGVAARAP